jgi:alpha-beta hydrolase superfamily lysophospholipase
MPIRLIPNRRAAALAGLILAAAAALAGCINLDTRQREWIFNPQRAEGEPEARTDGFEDVWIPLLPATPGDSPMKLHALWLDGPSADAPVLLYLHGARRDVDSSAFRIAQMQSLGFAVLAIDYRGFGYSSDALPSESTVDADARAAWQWLAQHHGAQPRYIFGHSLGGAIAVRLATEVDDVKGLIIEGTFTSIPAVFETMKWGWLPIGPLITQRFDSVDRIAKVSVPVLVVHGGADSLIPPALGRALFDRVTTPKRFVLVEGGTHYTTNRLGREQYRAALQDLFGVGG